MELRDYLMIIRRWWWLLVLPILVFAFGLGWYTHNQPVVYDSVAAISFVKNAKVESQKSSYNYDNYYAVQTSALLVETANGWLADPVVIASIYQAAHVALPSATFTGYDKLIKVVRLPGATLTVTTTSRTPAEANQLAVESIKVVHDRLTQLMAQGALEPVELFESKPIGQARTNGTTISIVIGVAAGALLGLLLVFSAEYLKPTTTA